MVYEDQLLPTEVWISLPFECAFLLFHVVVTLFIGVQRIRGTPVFASAFFLFFILLSIADIGNYCTVRIVRKTLLNVVISSDPVHATYCEIRPSRRMAPILIRVHADAVLHGLLLVPSVRNPSDDSGQPLHRHSAANDAPQSLSCSVR
jgi:hypothetical protein